MNRKNIGKKISRCNGYSLFFIEPKIFGNVDYIANELIALNSVKEVGVTSGKYGFLVKCKPYDKREMEVLKHIKKKVGNVSKLECHYTYMR